MIFGGNYLKKGYKMGNKKEDNLLNKLNDVFEEDGDEDSQDLGGVKSKSGSFWQRVKRTKELENIAKDDDQ